jgi:anti-sigma factor RsiW
MTCGQAKLLFSPYLDGAVSGTQMQSLSRHLEGCARCNQQYISLRQTQQLLGKVGRRKAPADLGLKLRVALSQEIARSKRPLLDSVRVRLANALNAIMVPATAGLASAVVVFGLLMGFMAMPLQAGSADVPLVVGTDPQLQQISFGASLDSIHEGSLVIEADVDSHGRVQDYRILSDEGASPDLLPQVKNMLIFTTFRPATTLGRPTAGRAVLSFSKISVRG